MKFAYCTYIARTKRTAWPFVLCSCRKFYKFALRKAQTVMTKWRRCVDRYSICVIDEPWICGNITIAMINVRRRTIENGRNICSRGAILRNQFATIRHRISMIDIANCAYPSQLCIFKIFLTRLDRLTGLRPLLASADLLSKFIAAATPRPIYE